MLSYPSNVTNYCRDRVGYNCFPKALKMMSYSRASRRFKTSKMRSALSVRTSSLTKKSKALYTRKSPKVANNWSKWGPTQSIPWSLLTCRPWKELAPASELSSSFFSTLTSSWGNSVMRLTSIRTTWNLSLVKSMKWTTNVDKKKDRARSNSKTYMKNTTRRSVCSFSLSCKRQTWTSTLM